MTDATKRAFPRCNRCDGLLFGGECPAPACNNSPDYKRWPDRKLLREQKQMLQDAFIGKRVAWSASGYGNEGEGVVRDVRIHHGQIFYHFEGRSEGIKRARLDEWTVIE